MARRRNAHTGTRRRGVAELLLQELLDVRHVDGRRRGIARNRESEIGYHSGLKIRLALAIRNEIDGGMKRKPKGWYVEGLSIEKLRNF